MIDSVAYLEEDSMQSDNNLTDEQIEDDGPLYPAHVRLPEITFRAVIISIILAALLAAANAYLALKMGTTISASIPASVLAIGILRFFKNSNVLESNIIQTAASAGEGVAAAVSFILPAMIVLHYWQGFPYWQTMMITSMGGLLGVLFSIPLRRVLLNLPRLKFPEGTAIGKVLKMSAAKNANQMRLLGLGALVGSLASFAQSGLQLISDNLQLWFQMGRSLVGMGFGFAPATFAAGYIIGIEVGVSLLVGVVLSWGILVPILSHYYGMSVGETHFENVMTLWSQHLRYVGVGVMSVGGVWTLLKLIRPVIEGIKISFATLRTMKGEQSVEILRTEKDLSILWVLIGTLVLAVGLFFVVMYEFSLHGLPVSHVFLLLTSMAIIAYVVLVGFLLATICGYFTGMVGSTNNPLSGVLIISVLLLSFLVLVIFQGVHHDHHSVLAMKLVSVVIIVTTVMATVASIANENLQDLKAGQAVGATPMKQQIMLGVGVVVSSFVIAPVLELLLNAYGMGGVMPHPGMNPAQMLAAPQASLMGAVAKGVLTHHLTWGMIFLGMGFAVGIIIIDEILKHRDKMLPSLAVGLGMYLPPLITTPIIMGSIVSYLVHRKLKKQDSSNDEHNQSGVLLACGLVAGSSLMGVFLAIPFVIAGSADVLAILPHGMSWLADILGVIFVLGLGRWMYKVALSK